ncbi:MAG: hypothetical protein AB8G99_17055 [Planctomycetaceae bacterium]
MFSLFHWTLRRDTIAMRTHLLRGAFAATMLLVLFIAWLRTLQVGAAGLNLFRVICAMNILVSTLAGISYFATCVSEESEAGNLGLLKLAGLNSFSILIGKSTSRLVGALMLLVVQFPFTLLAITLGGVTLIQIVAAYLAIGLHLILVANLALFFSVFCSSSGRAAAWTGFVTLLFYGSSAVLNAASGTLSSTMLAKADAWIAFQSRYSVVATIDQVLKPAFGGPVLSYQMWATLVLSAILFGIACLGFERSTLRQNQGNRAGVGRARKGFGRLFGVSRVWKNALAWKEFYFLTGGHGMFLLRTILFGVLGLVVFSHGKWGTSTHWSLISQTLGGCALGLVGFECLVYATRVLFDESRWGTFPLLLILPMSPKRLLMQKALGCLCALLPGLLCLGIAWCVFPGDRIQGLRDGRVVFIGINFLLLLHFTVLLSLFLKWVALPAAVCLVFLFNTCCPVMSIGLVLNDLMAESGGILLLSITMLTYWILLLLPLQVEIISRIEDAGNHEYGS